MRMLSEMKMISNITTEIRNTTETVSSASAKEGSTVTIALAITFTAIIILLIGCLLLYTKLPTVCIALLKGEENDVMWKQNKEPMFMEDSLGSPRITRSCLKLHELDLTQFKSHKEDRVLI